MSSRLMCPTSSIASSRWWGLSGSDQKLSTDGESADCEDGAPARQVGYPSGSFHRWLKQDNAREFLLGGR